MLLFLKQRETESRETETDRQTDRQTETKTARQSDTGKEWRYL